jgi:hypothetical protein
MKALTKELKALVVASGSRLMDLPGVGPVVAARVLADVGDVARFVDRNRFASWTGTGPIEASSREIVRHRLSRAGNRRMNHMIHIAATTQIRLDTEGRAYYRRKLAAGKTRAEAMRCLKAPGLRRPLSTAPHRRSCGGGGRGSGRAPRGVTSIQRGRLTPAHRHFGSATSRTRTRDATCAHLCEEDRDVEAPRNSLLTSEGCQIVAPGAKPREARRTPGIGTVGSVVTSSGRRAQGYSPGRGRPCRPLASGAMLRWQRPPHGPGSRSVTCPRTVSNIVPKHVW